MKRKNLETTLFWFRSDLRLNDSHALYRASFTDNPVVGLFIFSPQDYKNHDMAAVKLEFLMNNLRILKEECTGLNIPLIILKEENAGNVANRVKDFALEISATAAFWNIEYEVNEGKR
jgi:deoxyribodipyrimidine photo-lyase